MCAVQEFTSQFSLLTLTPLFLAVGVMITDRVIYRLWEPPKDVEANTNPNQAFLAEISEISEEIAADGSEASRDSAQRSPLGHPAASGEQGHSSRSPCPTSCWPGTWPRTVESGSARQLRGKS